MVAGRDIDGALGELVLRADGADGDDRHTRRRLAGEAGISRRPSRTSTAHPCSSDRPGNTLSEQPIV